MRKQDNIIFIGSGLRPSKSSSGEGVQKLVNDCRNLIDAALSNTIRELFEHLDDTLYELANKSESDNLQTVYFDAMRQLRKDRLHIEHEFCEQAISAYDGYWKTGHINIVQRTLDDLSQDSHMSLLDNDELEESLAISTMTAKNENRYSHELHILKHRFHYLFSGEDKQELPEGSLSPIEPAVICPAFQTALSATPLDLKAKLVVYKLFERHITQSLGTLYSTVNQFLDQSGLGKKGNAWLRVKRVENAPNRSGQSDQERRRQSQTAPTKSDPTPNTATAANRGNVFKALQQLLSANRTAVWGDDPAEPADDTSGRQASIDTAELLSTLSIIQQANLYKGMDEAAQPVYQDPNDIRAQLSNLQNSSADTPAKSLRKEDYDTIDVISMLFEFILDDLSLPDAMKVLISRLQIPMLKVAIADKAFFSRNDHPAHRLLDQLCLAALEWTDPGERDKDTLYHKIATVVKSILNEFRDDISLLDDLANEFTIWWSQEQRNAAVAEHRTNQVIRGKEQLQNAKRIVTQEINQRLDGIKEIPEAAMDILEDGMKDVLLLNYLRQGPDSKEWQESLQVVDRLLWSIEPKQEYADRQALLRTIPELLRNLRERLNSISYDQHKMARLFKELQNCHIGCLRGQAITELNGPGTAISRSKQVRFPDMQLANDAAAYLLEEDELSQVVLDQFNEDAGAIEIGTWFDVQHGNTLSRVKLSWRSTISDSFIFVDRKGMKVIELTKAGLAKHLREGTAKQISIPDEPIVQRALEAMIHALEKNKQSNAG